MNRDMLNEGDVNTIMGTNVLFGGVHPIVLLTGAMLFFLMTPIIFKNLFIGIPLFMLAFVLMFLFLGNNPQQKLQRRTVPKQYRSGHPTLEYDRAGLPKMELPSVKTNYNFIEANYKSFKSFGQMAYEGLDIGYYLLQRGKRELMFIFAFRVKKGQEPTLTDDMAWSGLKGGTAAVTGATGIDFKSYWHIHRSADEPLVQLADEYETSTDPLSQALTQSAGENLDQLESEGRLVKSDLIYFAKYRMILGADFEINQGWMDAIAQKVTLVLSTLKDDNFDSLPGWGKAIRQAYVRGYRRALIALTASDGFGLDVETLGVQEIMDIPYQALHPGESAPLGQYIRTDDHSEQPEVIIQDYGDHDLGTIFEPYQGLPTTPEFTRSTVYIPSTGKHWAFIRLGKVRHYPVDNQSVPRGYLKFLWTRLTTPTPFWDCQVITELTEDPSDIEINNMDLVMKNSMKRIAKGLQEQSPDVTAEMRLTEAKELQGLIKSGCRPFWASCGIWVYRESKQEVIEACNELIDRLKTVPTELVTEQIEQYWFQSFPFEWNSLLTKPFVQRPKYLNYQAVPLLPQVQMPKMDDQGQMFLGQELPCPLYLDLLNKSPNHTAIFATTGNGKSGILSGILFSYILNRRVTIVFEYPRPNGESTYTDLVNTFNRIGVSAAYHNVKEHVINILELPDMRWVDALPKPGEPGYKSTLATRADLFESAFNNHLAILQALVMGTTDDPTTELMVSSFLSRCYEAFHQVPDIQRRYQIASEAAFGTPESQQMPIYEEFVDFAENWFIQDVMREDISDLEKNTIGLIRTQLKGVLSKALGRSINGISSFDSNVQCLVLAMTNVSDSIDSLIYSMVGFNLLLRKAMSTLGSALITDEGTRIYKFASYARLSGRVPSEGRKWACNYIVAATEVETIYQSVAGNEIFTNLQNIFCGGLQDISINRLCNDLGFRREILEKYVGKGISHTRQESYWYWKRDTQHVEVSFNPSSMLMGLVATGKEEVALRDRILEHYPHDPITGYRIHGDLLARAHRAGLCPSTITEDQYVPLPPASEEAPAGRDSVGVR